MCDTLIALSNVTADGSVLFAKNTDREPNEAHQVTILPAKDYPAGSRVKTTYIEIPQATHTYSVILAKPYWMWGTEMGANEHGVVISNEGTFTHHSVTRKGVLTGMDINRLTLERAANADEALQLILDLVEQFGQGGNGGHRQAFYYQNSFIVADPKKAWIIEFSKNEWAYREIKDYLTVSNELTIHDQWEKASENLVNEAVKKWWWRDRSTFDYCKAYSDWLFTHFSDGPVRQRRSMELLKQDNPAISLGTYFRILRDHGARAEADAEWTPANGIAGMTLCAHMGFGPIRIDQTVGSFVAHLTPQGNTYWVTCSAAPCTSIYKPVWIDAGMPPEPDPTDRFDPQARWWRHELLHREIMRDYATRMPIYRSERDALEKQFLQAASECREAPGRERQQLSKQFFTKADAATLQWLEAVRSCPIKRPAPWLHRATWGWVGHESRFQVH